MASSKRGKLLSRARKIRGQRVGLVYALLLITEAGVLALAWFSGRAIQRQREIVQRNLVEFANFGATNFAYRAGAALANHARIFQDGVEALGAKNDDQLLKAGRERLDSLEACRCEAAFRIVTVSLLNSDGKKIASIERQPVNVPSIPPRALATLIGRSRTSPQPDFSLRLSDETDTTSVLALARIPASPEQRERFLVASYDLRDVREYAFNYIYNSRPTLLPPVFGAPRWNDSTIAVRVVLPEGRVLYSSANASGTTFSSSVPFGPDTLVRVQAVLLPEIQSELMEAADSSFRAVWIVFVTVVATVVIALVAIVTRRAAKLATLQGDFTAAVSHELRTPLTEIMLYAELIVAGKTDGQLPTRGAAGVILAEARRLYQLVENVLVIARTDRRMLRVRINDHDLVPIVRTTLATISPWSEKRSVELESQLPEAARALCDPSAVTGILINLLENAMRYGPEGQRVIVRVINGDDSVLLEVDDAGPGIPEADRTRVLEAYVRLERDVDTNTSGSGLGLAVVSALVANMNSTLSISSSLRGGTLVRVSFPRA